MKNFLLIFILMPVFVSGQNLDSLYNVFLSSKGIQQAGRQQNIETEKEAVKCSFGLVNQIKYNYGNFSLSQQALLKLLLQRPASDTSFVTPKGNFRIHYIKTGNDAPLYDLNLLAAAADSAYNYEVNILGYPKPPADLGEGGDNLYDIYLLNLSGEYGYTEFENQIAAGRYTSYMVIDNDFAGSLYNTHGIDGARVTVAHEFHHGIQIGNYVYRQEDNFYYELTSTAMEEFVYNDINDYYFYMSSYFRNPQRAFSSNDGYDLAVWNLFLRDRFGVEIIKRIWELMPSRRALESFSEAIREAGSVFKVEFNKFGVWNYFTGPRAVAGKYYKEAANYPVITPGVLTNSISVNSEAVSNNYLLYTGSSSSLLVSIISNCDISGGIKTSPGITPFTYTVSTGPVAGGRNILGSYYSKLESQTDPSLSLFSQSNIFNNIPVNEGNIIADETDYPFPQPFRYSSSPEIFFPASLNGNGSADLNIYTIDMRLVFSGSKRIVTTDKIYVGWDAHDNSGKRLGSGVYIYVTKSGDTIKKGKFVIYND